MNQILRGSSLILGSAVLLCILLTVWAEANDEEAPSTHAILNMMEEASGNTATENGEAMFLAACTQCHDAQRSTAKTKPLVEWRGTVRRMAAKPGANVPEEDIEPIAEYLASLNAVDEPAAVEEPRQTPTITEVLAVSSVTMHGTVSLLWRKGDEQVENEGFFPDIWFGAEWRPEANPFSAQVTACTTCHDDGSGGMNLELVEGSFSADLFHLLTGESAAERTSGLQLDAKAGRFAVPFGAFSGMAHPGVYRTLTHPLMYNMGRRVGYYEPVLPMPYADEGVGLGLGMPLPSDFMLRLDGYAVNGLQEGGFYSSRSWQDNNSDVALGGRATLGCSWFVIGGSYAEGELQASDTPEKTYRLLGGDVTLRYLDWIRAYYEYARREEDTTLSIESRFSGHVVEVEGRLWKKPKVTVLARYDTIQNSAAYGGATIERVTWGPNITLPGGSLFIINHEHWKHEAPLYNEDIIGIRWIASF